MQKYVRLHNEYVFAYQAICVCVCVRACVRACVCMCACMQEGNLEILMVRYNMVQDHAHHIKSFVHEGMCGSHAVHMELK